MHFEFGMPMIFCIYIRKYSELMIVTFLVDSNVFQWIVYYIRKKDKGFQISHNLTVVSLLGI